MPHTVTITIDLDALRHLPARQFKAAVLALAGEPSRTRVGARASLSLDSKNLEREEEVTEQLPRAWREAAERERQRVNKPPVDLDFEYRKAVLWYADKRNEQLRLGGWLLWALKTRLDGTNAPRPVEPTPERSPPPAPAEGDAEAMRAEIKQRGELRQFFQSGERHWPSNRGPRPGEVGCRYPAAMVEECRERYQQGGKDDASKQAPPTRDAPVEAATCPETAGTGISLSDRRRMVRAHGGVASSGDVRLPRFVEPRGIESRGGCDQCRDRDVECDRGDVLRCAGRRMPAAAASLDGIRLEPLDITPPLRLMHKTYERTLSR